MRKKKSILFIRPDYHCSFFYREQLRKLGWTADIYVNPSYPENLLYSDVDILRAPKIKKNTKVTAWLNHLLLLCWWLTRFWRYSYHVYYGRPGRSEIIHKLGLDKLFGSDFVMQVWLAKFCGVKLIYLPSGCHEDESKENFTKLDNGNVCSNCGYWNKCDDKQNNLNFALIRRFFDMQIGFGSIDSSQFKMTHMKYKIIDIDLWRPELEIPIEYRLPKTNKIRILHSAYLKNSSRSWQGRNIKGSPHVVKAIERLQSEGYEVEYFFIENKPSNQMRFYQAQADIVVEQLIYGWWGSTFVETAALGKPVVCYLRPSWKEFFLKTFPEYDSLPIIEANTETIYDELKKLVVEPDYRIKKGIESRRFAEAHFDPQKNTKEFVKILEAL